MTFGSPLAQQVLKPNLTYLIGEPGSGKSTLAAHLTRGLRYAERDKPFSYRLYTCGVYELGKRRPDFPGTDALSMSVQPRVIEWLESSRPFLVFGEGDRLGTESFFAAAEAIGYTVNVWLLAGAEAAALQRRIRGSAQDETWITGRRNKALNICRDRQCERLDAGQPPILLEAHMSHDPVIQQLRTQR